MSAIVLRSKQKRGSLQKCYLMRLAPSEDMPTWDDAADSLFNAGQTLNPLLCTALWPGSSAGFSPKNEHHFAANGRGA